MKKKHILIVSLLLTSLFVLSCGSGSASQEQNNNVDTLSKNPVYQEGLQLVSSSDCFTCHTVSESGTGPSFESIAERYKGKDSLQFLVSKIQKGGSGSWGTIPMIQHPNISKEDGEKIVKYILLLKKS